MRHLLCATLLIWLFQTQLEGQDNILAFRSSYGANFPFADLSQRYGSNLEASAGFEYQKENGLTFGISWAFLFGNKVKYDALSEFRKANGVLIGIDGLAADVYSRGRGQQIGVDLSYNFGRAKSGFITGSGLGYLTYYSTVKDDTRSYIQIFGKYNALYNLKAFGPYIKPFLGFHYKSSSGLINGKMVLETCLSFTKFAQASPYNAFYSSKSTFSDHSFGLTVVWLLPLKKSGDSPVKYF